MLTRGILAALTLKQLGGIFRRQNLRSILWLTFRFARRSRNTPTTFQFAGLTFHVPDFLSVLWQLQEIFVDDFYRFRPTSQHPLIIDCGANVGTSALWFAQTYPNAQILAFEADPHVFVYLAGNLARNGITNVTARQAAVWTHPNGVTFASTGADSGGIHLAGKLSVPSSRLADVLAQHPVVDFLKIDIEGAETAVLIDCAPQLAHVQQLFLEYHSPADAPSTLPEILSILRQAGFEVDIRNAQASRFSTPYLYHPDQILLNLFAWRPSNPN